MCACLYPSCLYCACCTIPQAFILYTGQYADMLDSMVYYCTFMSATATFIAMALEIAVPHDFWSGTLKCYGMWLQVNGSSFIF